VLWLFCASLAAAGCGGFVERVTKPTPEETRHLEEVLDPLAELSEIIRRDALIESQRLGPLGRADEELSGLLLVQQATSRDSASHRRAYEVLDRSIQSWIFISEAFLRAGDAHDLDDEIEQSMAMLNRTADHNAAACGPHVGVVLASDDLQADA
jgi:hypothetical protein